MWVEGSGTYPILRVAPLDVAGPLFGALWTQRTAVLTTATLPARLPTRLGVPQNGVTELDAGSPFDYEEQAVLYRAGPPAGPPPGTAGTDSFWRRWPTSWPSDRGRGRADPGPLHRSRVLDETCGRASRPRLGADPHAAVGPQGAPRRFFFFWRSRPTPPRACSPRWALAGHRRAGRGVLPGGDRPDPLPRPDEPLLQARRSWPARMPSAASTCRALPPSSHWGTGRLIRTATDRGVVAVLDPRLATASYRWDIVRALPDAAHQGPRGGTGGAASHPGRLTRPGSG